MEQAAFQPNNTVPGTGLSPDKMLLARGFSYADAHRARLGVNYQQIPVNRPKAPVRSYSKDGAMRVDNVSDPVYYPNSVAGAPAADSDTYAEHAVWAADGEMVRAAYTLHAEDDDYGQARTLLTEVMDDAARDRLVDTVSGNLAKRATRRRAPAGLRVLAQHRQDHRRSDRGGHPRVGARAERGLPAPPGDRRRPCAGPTARVRQESTHARAIGRRVPMTLVAPFAGTVVQVEVEAGDTVRAGATVVILESMKMEHVVVAATPGRIDSVAVAPGAAVQTGDVLATMTESAGPAEAAAVPAAPEAPDGVRPELAELLARVAATTDAGRPAATERRHAGGRRTARENIEDLCDPGSFEEYGGAGHRGAAGPAQPRRPGRQHAGRRTGGRHRPGQRGPVRHRASRCAVLSYDYSVLAGTQGQMNHRKKDRLFDLVERLRLPVVLFAEGGGGRPGDTDHRRGDRARHRGVRPSSAR